MQLKPYPEYKESGISWLGIVPVHWKKTKLKRVSQVQSGITLGKSYTNSLFVEYPYLRVANVQNGFLNLEQIKTITVPEKEAESSRLIPGDVLVTEGGDIDKLGRGAIWNGEIENCLHQNHIFVIRPIKNQLLPSFLVRTMESHHGRAYFYLTAKKTTNLASTNQTTLGLLPLFLPDLVEQKQIASFLSWKSAQINKFIRNKRRLIELLKEKKQHIINQAVTRGIDPNVKLKPSGVVWIGDIPEHWKLCRLRNVVSSVTSGSRGWSQYAADDGPLFIRIANLCRTSLDLRFDNVVRLNLPNTSEIQRTLVQPGDILVSITAYIGSIAVAPDEFETAYVSQHVARCSPLSYIINSRWLGYVLLSNVGQFHGQINLYGGTKDGLSLDDVKSYPVLLPPKSEQDVIVKYIQDESQVIDQAITRTQREIELMREYRSRLIADVVTGQVDVRGIDVPEVAEEAGTNEYSPLHDEDTADADDWLDADEDLKAGE